METAARHETKVDQTAGLGTRLRQLMTRVSYMIPFAAADPLRVIPALMVGSAVTGALVMGFGNTSRAPHGGIWVVGLVGKPVLYVLAIIIGTVVTAAGVIILKSTSRKEAEEVEPAASREATATS